ncbi:MAG: DUF4157 domain-containing protein, partial [Cyanobacteria bacterium P01_F01_bin.53]
MSNRSSQHTKAPAQTSNFASSNQIQTRPFVVQQKAESSQDNETDAQHEHASLLDINLVQNLGVQAKLTIGQPNDQYEQEADQVASQVVERINSPQVQQQSIQRQDMAEEEEELQMKPLASTIQRQEVPEEEEELQMHPLVQRKSVGGSVASENLESSIEIARGQGQPLGVDIRGSMEQAFGADFNGVRIHTDAQSNQLNQSIQAKAFTTGQDIFFRQGAYQPDNRSGQELLAHELTHVVQQTGHTSPSVQPQAHDSSNDKALTHNPSSFITSNTSGISIQRDSPKDEVEMLPEMTITNESMPAATERDASAAEAHFGNQFSFGLSSITDREGNLSESNPLVSNARARGRDQGADDLQGLAGELSEIRPLYLAWVRANASVNSIATNEG